MQTPLIRHLSRRTVLQGGLAIGLTGIVAKHAVAQGATPEMAKAPIGPSGDFAGLVDIGSKRNLYTECRGSGAPNVILEAGYRSPANVWTDDLIQPTQPRTMVLPGVAAFSRVCAYERPGTDIVLDGVLHKSRSTPIPMPRTAQSVVDDLHTLLQVTHVPPPYVLVGHSLGGLLVRLYASTYPDEVVGLVLVDAWSEALQDLLTPEQWAAYVHLNSAIPPEIEGDLDYETIDFAAASAEMRQAATVHPLRPMPLVVLSHAQPFGVPEDSLGFSPEVLERAWASAQDQLAALVPHAQHVIATESGHYIQLQQPDLVIEAVRQVVEAIRSPGTWGTPVATQVRGTETDAGYMDTGIDARIW